MTRAEQDIAYSAYAELEAAAEEFYAAAAKMGRVVPSLSSTLNRACEDLNTVIVEVDGELDEVM